MIKILSAEQIKEADNSTIRHEPVSSIDLMERAASAFTELFAKKYSTEHTTFIFCGYGNNGGDGLAIARLLIEKGYTVSVYVLADSKNYSDDFLINQSRLESSGKLVIHPITSPDDFPRINTGSVIIDALFGSGLNRALAGVAEKLVLYLNIQNAVRIAVDIPSGLFADWVSDGAVFMAHHTITFQQPKLSFLFPENAPVTGQWESVDIGLDKKFMDSISCNHFLIEKPDIEKIIHQRRKFDHKGIFGHALLYAGSKGKMGAAILCAKAALRSGTGLTTVLIPAGTEGILNVAIPEAMTMSYSLKGKSSTKWTAFSAVASGPGIGTDSYSTTVLLKLLKEITAPSVFDADALNIVAAQKKGLKLL
ncbi:MAG TPA: NAD(P)H-hydrate epimerase, partial [Chitinophagales bacterium]|nr:NAD(P)H-hydrate epimerase [Chitinophagales bacterium]